MYRRHKLYILSATIFCIVLVLSTVRNQTNKPNKRDVLEQSVGIRSGTSGPHAQSSAQTDVSIKTGELPNIDFVIKTEILAQDEKERKSAVQNEMPQELEEIKTPFQRREQIDQKPSANTTQSAEKVQEKKKAEQPSCRPKQNVVFLRTHKTGSSSLQTLFYRYAENHNLNIGMPISAFGAPQLFAPRFVKPSKREYNMLLGHARFSKVGYEKIMPPDTAYVTIIRDPGTQLQSLYNYYGWNRRFKVDLKTFVKDPDIYYARQSPGTIESAHNPNLFDLGLDRKSLSDTDAIRNHIQYLDQSFNLVLITEYFLESLILMKEELCWDFKDLIFMKKNVRATSGHSMDAGHPDPCLEASRRWNAGDMALYTYFNTSLWRKIDEYGRARMEAEVKEFKGILGDWQDLCVGEVKEEKRQGVRVVENTLRADMTSNKTCVQLIRENLDYLRYFQRKQSS